MKTCLVNVAVDHVRPYCLGWLLPHAGLEVISNRLPMLPCQGEQIVLQVKGRKKPSPWTGTGIV